MGKVREAEKTIRPAVKNLINQKCKKIILGCTELPVAIFAYKSFKKIKPPIHCELDLHNKRGSSIFSIFSIIEKPVAVNPDTDSK